MSTITQNCWDENGSISDREGSFIYLNRIWPYIVYNNNRLLFRSNTAYTKIANLYKQGRIWSNFQFICVVLLTFCMNVFLIKKKKIKKYVKTNLIRPEFTIVSGICNNNSGQHCNISFLQILEHCKYLFKIKKQSFL